MGEELVCTQYLALVLSIQHTANMTPKDLTTLKAALKILKKGHKPCKTFSMSCSGCQHTVLLGLLEDEIELYKWVHKWDEKI